MFFKLLKAREFEILDPIKAHKALLKPENMDQNFSDDDSASGSECDKVLSEESSSTCTDGDLDQDIIDLTSKDGQFNFSNSPPNIRGRPMAQNTLG